MQVGRMPSLGNRQCLPTGKMAPGGGVISFGRAPAIFRPVKAVVDPIVAELHAEGI
jgi:hypothetical protein